jgi:Curli assembly protein CsgE
MKCSLLKAFLLVLGFHCSPGQLLAQTSSQMADGQVATSQGPALGDSPEYGGIVTSQVLTSLGHYFHNKFTENWNTYGDIQTYVLLVREVYSPRYGTEIRVIYNERIVFRGVLPRNLVAVADIGRSAAETAHSNVVEIGLQSLLFNDPDAAKSDF